MSKCNKCEYSERYKIGMYICWRDPANPKVVTQDDADCDYYTENEAPKRNKKD